MAINKAPSLEEHLKALDETSTEIPDRIAVQAANLLLGLAREWANSEDGKKELQRRKTNKLHREEYSKRKAKDC